MKSQFDRRMSNDPSLSMGERRFSIDAFGVNKDSDLKKIKDEAVNQMEKLVASTNKIHELEDMNYFLQTENEVLLKETEELKKELQDREAMENELHEQLADMSTKLAVLSIENETQRLEELTENQGEGDPVIKKLKDTELLNQFRRCQFEIKALREKLMEQNSKIKAQKQDIKILHDEVERLQLYNSELEQESEMTTDDRTKKELLEIIRSRIEEKVYWEAYAETLLRLILVHNPEMLDVSLLKTYSQISSSELVDKWNEHIASILSKLPVITNSDNRLLS